MTDGTGATPREATTMQCPTDGSALMISQRSGVEIDSCPRCHGVWLDRGELDKIIARADGSMPRFPPSMPPLRTRAVQDAQQASAGRPAESRGARHGNWLADLFDDTQPQTRPEKGSS